MKNFLFTFYTVLFLVSCKQKQEVDAPLQTSLAATYVQDTLQKHRIDSIVDVINKDRNEQGVINKISFPIYNQNDSIMYWQRNGEISIIEANLIYPEKLVWPTYYLLNEELIYIRYRFVAPNYPSFVMETLIYLNGDEIVYCLERKMDLKPGEMPGLLRGKELKTCSGTHEKVISLYNTYWPSLIEYVTADINKKK